MRYIFGVSLLFACIATPQFAVADSRVGISLSLPPFDHIYYSSGSHHRDGFYPPRYGQWRHSTHYRLGYQGYNYRPYRHGHDFRDNHQHGYGQRSGRAPISRSFSHSCR